MAFRIAGEPAPDWLASNRANWEERLPLHLASDDYSMDAHRAGRGTLHPIEDTELGPVDGLRILHLQCRFGRDSFALAQRGAHVTGIDFGPEAIAAARRLAAELGLEDRTHFVEANVLEADRVLDAPASFDMVYSTWGTICWLPDIRRWAEVVAHFLSPGGCLYFADMHPFAAVFDSETATEPDRPGWFLPYFGGRPLVDDAPRDYTGDCVALETGNLHEWLHPIGGIVGALLAAGLEIRALNEHDSLPWPPFGNTVEGPDGMYRWPETPWLPLAVSIRAEKPAA